MYEAKIDGDAIIKLAEFIGMGICYEHNGNKSFVDLYPNYVAAAMPIESEHFIQVLLKTFDEMEPSKIFRDDGRYDNEVKYAAIFSKDKAIVYFSIFNPLMGNNKAGTQSRIFAITFSSNNTQTTL